MLRQRVDERLHRFEDGARILESLVERFEPFAGVHLRDESEEAACFLCSFARGFCRAIGRLQERDRLARQPLPAGRRFGEARDEQRALARAAVRELVEDAGELLVVEKVLDEMLRPTVALFRPEIRLALVLLLERLHGGRPESVRELRVRREALAPLRDVGLPHFFFIVPGNVREIGRMDQPRLDELRVILERCTQGLALAELELRPPRASGFRSLPFAQEVEGPARDGPLRRAGRGGQPQLRALRVAVRQVEEHDAALVGLSRVRLRNAGHRQLPVEPGRGLTFEPKQLHAEIRDHDFRRRFDERLSVARRDREREDRRAVRPRMNGEDTRAGAVCVDREVEPPLGESGVRDLTVRVGPGVALARRPLRSRYQVCALRSRRLPLELDDVAGADAQLVVRRLRPLRILVERIDLELCGRRHVDQRERRDLLAGLVEMHRHRRTWLRMRVAVVRDDLVDRRVAAGLDDELAFAVAAGFLLDDAARRGHDGNGLGARRLPVELHLVAGGDEQGLRRMILVIVVGLGVGPEARDREAGLHGELQLDRAVLRPRLLGSVHQPAEELEGVVAGAQPVERDGERAVGRAVVADGHVVAGQPHQVGVPHRPESLDRVAFDDRQHGRAGLLAPLSQAGVRCVEDRGSHVFPCANRTEKRTCAALLSALSLVAAGCSIGRLARAVPPSTVATTFFNFDHEPAWNTSAEKMSEAPSASLASTSISAETPWQCAKSAPPQRRFPSVARRCSVRAPPFVLNGGRPRRSVITSVALCPAPNRTPAVASAAVADFSARLQRSWQGFEAWRVPLSCCLNCGR